MTDLGIAFGTRPNHFLDINPPTQLKTCKVEQHLLCRMNISAFGTVEAGTIHTVYHEIFPVIGVAFN